MVAMTSLFLPHLIRPNNEIVLDHVFEMFTSTWSSWLKYHSKLY